jgi:hypothetical protein
MMIYLLAIGSPTHAVPPEAWHAWKRPAFEYEGFRYINPNAPLFIHQYSHAWFDFHAQRDRYADYFENSITATKAHRLFCLNCGAAFPNSAKIFGELPLPTPPKVTWPGAAHRNKANSTAI